MNPMLLIFKFIALFLSLGLIKPVTNYLNQSYCQCNIKNKKGRIYNAARAGYDEYTFVALLFNRQQDWNIDDKWNPKIVCSATLINKSWLITAGHCLELILKTDLRPRSLSYAAIGLDHDPQKLVFNESHFREIVEKYPHPEYVLGSPSRDFGLLKLASPFELGEATNIYGVCFDDTGKWKSQIEYRTAGYGRGYDQVSRRPRPWEPEFRSKETIYAEELAGISVNKVFDEFYINKKRYVCFEDKGIFCARNKGLSMCEADEGGPLLGVETITKSQFYIGVASFGVIISRKPQEFPPGYPFICGGRNSVTMKFLVFSKFKYHLIKWIQNYTGQEYCHFEYNIDC